MSLNKVHVAAIATWFVTLVVVLGVRFSLGLAISPLQILTVVLAGCVPALVLIMVFRGAPRSVGQLLYETDRAPSEVKRGDTRDVR